MGHHGGWGPSAGLPIREECVGHANWFGYGVKVTRRTQGWFWRAVVPFPKNRPQGGGGGKEEEESEVDSSPAAGRKCPRRRRAGPIPGEACSPVWGLLQRRPTPQGLGEGQPSALGAGLLVPPVAVGPPAGGHRPWAWSPRDRRAGPAVSEGGRCGEQRCGEQHCAESRAGSVR